MSKYDRLGTYLRQTGTDYIPMSFAEIERVVGAKLPKSQGYPAWWSNSTSNNVMTQVWLDAGYRTEQVDTVGRKLVFKRSRETSRISATTRESAGMTGMSEEPRTFKSEEGENEKKPMRSPLFGSMKGTFTIEPGYDLTQPALPPEEWAEIEAEILAKFDRAFADSGKTS
jgi:hypothetical protein